MSRTKRYARCILAGAFALGIAWSLRQSRRDVSGLRVWRQVLIRLHGAEKAQQLVAAIRREHEALVAETPLPGNQALRWHLKENILPGLALYRVLLHDHGGNQLRALAEVDDAFRAQTLARNRLPFAALKLLPDPFQLLKWILPQMMKKFPAEGWDFTYVENDDNTIALNATRCYYLNTLTAHGAPELTASFCRTDDVMAELFPPSIRFVRPHTLGRGNVMCDFRYCRVRNMDEAYRGSR
jgi:hypothetical protein